MTRGTLIAWLDGVTPTRPFTITDAKELYEMIKGALPNALVDVYTTKGDKVHVLIDRVLVKDLDVVG